MIAECSRVVPVTSSAILIRAGGWGNGALRPSQLAAIAIAFSSLISLAYVWLLCPHDLASDEAHYWDWSLQLDWSYYSKGPLVAWLIRSGCELLGPASEYIRGDLSAAVRTPAVLCHAALLAGSYLLAAGVFRSARLGLFVVLAEASLPLVRVGSVLMTIDPPFLACWCWSLVCVWKAVEEEENVSQITKPRPYFWLSAGLFAALGTLAKYTMALFPLAVLGFLLCHQRQAFRRPGVWLFLAVAGTGWIPIIVWNASNEWASFRHVLGQVGGQAVGLRFNALGPLAFVGAQAGMMFCGWLIAFLAASWRFRPNREQACGVRLVWWCSAPVWGLFVIASVIKTGQPNWPAPAYVGGMVLAVEWVRWELSGKRQQLVRAGLVATVAASLAVVLGVHFPGLVRPTLAAATSPPTLDKPLPVRKLDITARLAGWKTLAMEVDRFRELSLQETGEPPVLAGTHWTIPGHLHFYCKGRPQAYSLGLADGSDRHSQYDYWRPNPQADAQAFLGKTFVIVGDMGPVLSRAFAQIEPAVSVTHTECGVPIAAWKVWVCRGFRGFECPLPKGPF